MAFHDRMRAMVIRNLAPQPKGKGVPITFSKQVGGGYDRETGGVYPIFTTDFNGSGVRVNYSEFAYKNETIVYGDFQIYLSPVTVDGGEMPKPSIGDEFLFLGQQARVINVNPFNDNGVDCGWKLQVRYG